MDDLTAKIITAIPLIIPGTASLAASVFSAYTAYESSNISYKIGATLSALALGAFGVQVLKGAKTIISNKNDILDLDDYRERD